ncbi:hypothetical protein FQR65_LT07249 [Abscondita terminalis]|nr:hypothetical protein FQR65_LT07249 [Abscondita terminalis]
MFICREASNHNKHQRSAALQSICANLNEIRPNTVENEVLKKWNGLHTYCAERRKYIESSRSGAGEDEIAKPSLWYYNKMLFLNEHLQVRKSTSSYCAPEVEV